MNLKELKKLVEDNEDAFSEMIGDESDETIDGVKFETIQCKRHNSEMEYIFKVEDKLYRLLGYYNSWSGTEWEDYTDFKQVKEKQVTITKYENI